MCYYDSGQIAQEITDWRPSQFMALRVTESTLSGRHWLSFIAASYELSAEGDQTRVVRHTTIGTRLYPRWYWRPLERWGVTSEHEFVFSICSDGLGNHEASCANHASPPPIPSARTISRDPDEPRWSADIAAAEDGGMPEDLEPSFPPILMHVRDEAD